MSPSRTPDPRVAEASAWIARLHADDRGPDDLARFRQWSADPANAEAFARASAIFEAAAGLGPRSHAGVSRRGLVQAGLACVALGGAGAVAWKAMTGAKVFTTTVAEVRALDLAPGVRVVLDADSRLRVSDQNGLRLWLERGRLNLAARVERTVTAGAGDVSVAGQVYRADLDLRPQGLRVAMLEGRAQVTGPGGVQRTLLAGERLLGDGAVRTIDVERVSAWRDGRLVFDGETLAEVCGDLNRYSDQKLFVDAAIASLPVSGVYRAGRSAEFARAMTQLAPVSATPVEGGIRLSARRATV